MAESFNAKNLRKTSRHENLGDIESALKAEIEKEDQEIEALRAKAEERRRRQEEDARREEADKTRLEIEKRAREEEEKRRKEELALRKKQQEIEKQQLQQQLQLNRDTNMVSAGGSKLGNVLKAKEDMLKSPEQLEQEKREIIASRLVKLVLDRQLKEDLIAQIGEFHKILLDLHSQIYDLAEKHDRQRYDMMELAERARQIEKGKAKTRKSNIVHTGLGGGVFPQFQEKFPHAPGKISLFSRYERVTDRRTFKDRRDLWAVEKEKEVFVPVRPKARIKYVDEPQKEEFPRKKNNEAKNGEEDEVQENTTDQQEE